MKVQELFNIWLNCYTKPFVKIRTYLKYEYVLNQHINPYLGNILLELVDEKVIHEYICYLLNKKNKVNNLNLSINTIYGIVQVLKQGFKLAFKLDLIIKNPTLNIKLPKLEEKEVLALTRDEQKRIEKYCLESKKQNYIGIIICLYTGIRLGELLALTWEDIDFNKRIISINKTSYSVKVNNVYKIIIDKPKTAKSIRVIPVPTKLLDILLSYKNKSNFKYVVCNKKESILENRSYQRTFKLILNKCNIKQYNFHCLRHTFATRALELGVDVKTLSEILGHTNVSITLNRYAHSLLEHKMKEMSKFDELL